MIIDSLETFDESVSTKKLSPIYEDGAAWVIVYTGLFSDAPDEVRILPNGPYRTAAAANSEMLRISSLHSGYALLSVIPLKPCEGNL